MEAAVLAPLAVFLVAALMMLCFAAHDRAYFTGAACEAALAQNAEEERDGVANQRMEQRIEERVLPGEAPQTMISGDGRSTAVTVSGWRSSVGFGSPFAWEEEIRIRRIHPAKDLRNGWFLRRAGEMLTGGADT